MVDCGHPPVIHFHAATKICSMLKGEQLPIGMIEHQEYHALSYTMSHGDLLVLYSDGITECCSPENIMFGDEQLAELITTYHELEPQAIIDKITEALSNFAGHENFDDDLSCIIILIGAAGKE